MSEDEATQPTDMHITLAKIGDKLAAIMAELDAITQRRVCRPVSYNPANWPPWPRETD